MKLSKEVILVLLVVFFLCWMQTRCYPTMCEPWKHGREIHCYKKEFTVPDLLTITNLFDGEVTFKISKWQSKNCLLLRNEYWTKDLILTEYGQQIKIKFETTKESKCRDLYIYECWDEKQKQRCADLLHVSSKVFVNSNND